MTDRPIAFEHDVPAIFNLLDRPGATQSFAGDSFACRELGSQNIRPVIQARANDLLIESVGRVLEDLWIIDGRESVVLLSVRDLPVAQFARDELVPIEIGAEGKVW